MQPLAPAQLEGFGVRLEPLEPHHAEPLARAASDGKLWELRYTSVPNPDGVLDYINNALEGSRAGHMLPWAVRDLVTNEIVGTTRYHDVIPAASRVEIGYTWYAARVHSTTVNPACKLLLLQHAFETLECGAVGLRTDILNVRSQRAIEKLGAQRDGVIRHNLQRRDGTVRDTVMYSILRDEWPAVQTRLRSRLGNA
jgi:RimJ/RimL family protein N-acetyltransferase